MMFELTFPLIHFDAYFSRLSLTLGRKTLQILLSSMLQALRARQIPESRTLTPHISVADCQPRKTMPEYEFITLENILITVHNTR